MQVDTTRLLCRFDTQADTKTFVSKTIEVEPRLSEVSDE